MPHEPLWLGPSGKRIIRTIRKFFQQHQVPEKLIIGLSGGPDSLALTAGIAKIRRFDQESHNSAQHSLASTDITAIIIDHQLQKNSAEFSQHSRRQAQLLGIEAHIIPVTVSPKSGMEADARTARYRALQEHAKGASILIAHTLDDQAETVLLGLSRGSGTRSLSGMPARKGNIYRPLLSARKEDTLRACHEWGLTPLLDEHNFNEKYLRATLRGVVMPTLAAELNPGIASSLAKTAELLAEDTAVLDEIALKHYIQARSPAGLITGAFSQQPKGLRTRIIRFWLAEAGFQVNFDQLTAIDQLISHFHGQGAVTIPHPSPHSDIYQTISGNYPHQETQNTLAHDPEYDDSCCSATYLSNRKNTDTDLDKDYHPPLSSPKEHNYLEVSATRKTSRRYTVTRTIIDGEIVLTVQ